jgi:3-oxoacyl-[acyl-carrier protein] reductase
MEEIMVLKDKVAIVTGSSRGIGAATVAMLASQGARVTVNYRVNREKAEEVLAGIRENGGQGIVVQADATDREQVEAMVDRTVGELGPVDILVNNANIYFPIKAFLEYSWEDFESKILQEMKALFFPCKAVAVGMARRRQGCIVNISSGLSRVPGLGFCAHSSAKSAVDGFSKALAQELGPHGIRVNVVAPGLTVTDATTNQPRELLDAIGQHTPLRRLAQPEDVARTVLFFCSEWAGFVTGAYLPVSGGIQML